MSQTHSLKRRVLKPSVQRLTSDQVMFAIEAGGDDNLILQELTKIVNGYLEECNRLGGGGLKGLMNRIPTCPIEEVALNMAIAAEQSKIKQARQ